MNSNHSSISLSICLFLLPVLAQHLAAQPQSEADGKKNAETKPALQPMKSEPQYGIVDKASEVPEKTIKLIGNIEEKNLTVEWNDWHNKFAKAVRQHMFTSYFEMIDLKQGLSTKYRCEVTADKHIKSVNIVKSSGDFWFDSRVVKAVNSLDGNEILAFPAQSKRTEIITEVGIQLGGPRRQEMDFGDVEYRELAPGETPEKPSR